MEEKKDGISFIEPLGFHDGLFYSGLLAGVLTLRVIMSDSSMPTVRGQWPQDKRVDNLFRYLHSIPLPHSVWLSSRWNISPQPS